jgi:hypothetical protein
LLDFSGGQKVFREQTTPYPLTADSFLQRHSDVGFSLTGMYAGFDKTPFELILQFRRMGE